MNAVADLKTGDLKTVDLKALTRITIEVEHEPQVNEFVATSQLYDAGNL